MRSLLSSLYESENRKISDQPLDTKTPGDLARRHFSVKWVVHRFETLPVEVESGVRQDLDKLVSSCQGRFSEMRGKYPNTPPDGFLVFDGAGTEVRRWFESARPKKLDTRSRPADDRSETCASWRDVCHLQPLQVSLGASIGNGSDEPSSLTPNVRSNDKLAPGHFENSK